MHPSSWHGGAAALVAVWILAACGQDAPAPEAEAPPEAEPEVAAAEPASAPPADPAPPVKDGSELMPPGFDEGAPVPASFPQGLPAPSGADHLGSYPGNDKGTGVRYETAASIDEIVAELSQGYAENGWDIVMSKGESDRAMLFANRDDATVMTAITTTPAGRRRVDVYVLFGPSP